LVACDGLASKIGARTQGKYVEIALIEIADTGREVR
jgi:hypothetical protein